jgi:hypothetical protein
MKADLLELHMGILQARLSRLKGKMQASMMKMNLKEENVDKYPDIDVEKEKLEFEAFNQKSQEIEHNLSQYEDKVLELSQI